MDQNEPIKHDHHEDQQIESNTEEMEDNINSEENTKKDGRGLLAAHQAQAKWEELYPFTFYSASSQGWFCKICQQYGEGIHWVSETVHFGEHPKRYLERHQNGNTHKNAVKQKQLFQRMRAKGSIYKQIVTGVGNSNQRIVERNRRVIKKFMKTVYFFARKRFAIRENFEDVINYLTDLGDKDIQEHLHQSSSRATYVSKASADE